MQFMRRINAAANEQSPKNVAKTAVPSTNKRAEVSK